MNYLTSFFLAVGGFSVAPFLVDLFHEFIDDAPDWFPFLVILVISIILWVVGAVFRWPAIGLFIGVIAFGAFLAWSPGTIDFLPESVNVKPPF